MAIVKFFPTKTSTLYSYYPNKNTGLDEVTDLSLYNSLSNTPEVSRTLIQFDNDEINTFLNANGITSLSSYRAYLKLYLARASEIPLEYTIYCHPVSSSWNMGIGRLANDPETTDGASWTYRDSLTGGKQWQSGSFTNIFGPYGTGSVTASYSTEPGGGNWWTQFYVTGNVNPIPLSSSQTFTHSDSKDIEIEVTTAVRAWAANWFPNDGIILKHDSALEFVSSSFFETNYFTSNTHTIYPPCLELRWNDIVYTPTGSVIINDNVVVNINNNKGEYQQDSIQYFRLNVRDKYPTRAFQTSSVYLNNKVLPFTSYWALKDYNTEEMIIDYDTIYTRVNADSDGNYIKMFCSGLEPERYYKLLIKSEISGSTIIFDNNNIFKVVR